VLQAGGLLAGGGVLGALSADRASADVTGQVGTQQDRVDVFGGAVDANSVNTENITLTGAPSDYFLPWQLEGQKTADGASDINYTFSSDANTRLLVFDDVIPGSGGSTGGLKLRYNNDTSISYTSYMTDGSVLSRDHLLLHDVDAQPFSGFLLFNRFSGSVRSNLAFRFDRNVLNYGSIPAEITLPAGTSVNISGTTDGFQSGDIYEYSLQY